MISAGGGSSLCLPPSINQVVQSCEVQAFVFFISFALRHQPDQHEAEGQQQGQLPRANRPGGPEHHGGIRGREKGEAILFANHEEEKNVQFELFLQVLVHCQAGLSRSPAVIAGFLVLKRCHSPSNSLPIKMVYIE